MWHAFAMGEYRNALQAALKDEVPASYTQFLIAESYRALGEIPNAVEWYRKILKQPDEEIVPTLYVTTRFRLARLLETLGKKDEARALYEEYLSFWGRADRPLPDVELARQRLASLSRAEPSRP